MSHSSCCKRWLDLSTDNPIRNTTKQTDRQTYRVEKQTDIDTDRQTDKQTDKHRAEPSAGQHLPDWLTYFIRYLYCGIRDCVHHAGKSMANHWCWCRRSNSCIDLSFFQHHLGIEWSLAPLSPSRTDVFFMAGQGVHAAITHAASM